MGFIESLLRHRQLLGSLSRPMVRHFAKPHQTFEQLEPRQLYSVVPVTDAAAALDITGIDKYASNYNGQSVIAWTNQGTSELNISALKADGTSLLANDISVVVPWDSSLNVFSGIAFNNAGQGVICAISDSGLVALQFTITDGELVFAENPIELTKESLATDYIINSVDVAIDGSGNFALAWNASADVDVTPANGQDPVTETLSSVYTVRYNDSTDAFGDVKTVWEAKTSIGSFSSADGSVDIAMAPDGTSVIAWNVVSSTFKADPETDQYMETYTSTASYFARYSTSSALVGSVTNVSTTSLAGYDVIEKNDISINISSSGSFIVTQDQYFTGTTETGTKEMAQITFRSFSNASKALSNVVKVNAGTSMISTSAFTISSNGNIVAVWTEAASEDDPELLHSQTYTNAGAKVGIANTLNLGVDPLTTLALITTGDTYRALYTGTDTEGGTDVVMTTTLQDLKADLTIDITGSTLPDVLTIGKDISGTMTFSIENIGGLAYSGKSTITLTLSADEILGNEDDIQIAIGSFSLNIEAGVAKSVTVTGIKILKTALPADGDGLTYLLFAKINPGTGADMNSENNTTSAEVTLAAPNTVMDIGADSITMSTTLNILIPGDTGTATVVIRNTGNTDLTKADTITVELYAVSADDPDGEGIFLGTKTLNLALASGATTKAVISFKITADVPVGAYTFKGVVALDGDVSSENDSVATEQSQNILWAFGQIEGRKGNAKLTLTEEDGSVVTFSLSGNGLGTVTITENGSYDVIFTGTNIKTSVSLTIKGGEDNIGLLHNITSESDLGSFAATGFALSGDLTLAYIKTLTLGDLTDDATHTFSFESDSTAAIGSITLGHASGLTLNTSLSIGTINILDTGGEGSSPIEITARSIDTLKTRVDKKNNSVGDFSGNITLTGNDDSLTFVALKSVSIAGAVTDSTWNVNGAIKAIAVTGTIDHSVIRSTGSISSVSADSLVGTALLAGITDSIADASSYPTSDSDFVNTSTIGSVTLKGAKAESTDFVISAFTVGTAKLGRITSSGSGSTFGVFVSSPNADTPKVKPFSSVSFNYLATPEAKKATSVTWTYGKNFTMPATNDNVSGFVLAGAPDNLPA